MASLLPLDLGVVMGLVMVWPVLALALAYRLFNFPDLTIEGSFALGAAAFASLSAAGSGTVTALIAAAVAGALLGACTGAIHTVLRINKFLAGIIVVAMSYTLCLRLMGAPNIGLLGADGLFAATQPIDTSWPGLQLGTALTLLTFLIPVLIGLRAGASSRWGLNLRTVGSNPDYGRALGLSEPVHLVAGLAGTNALAAIGGALLSIYQGFTDVSMGQGGLILALASLTIGERIVPQRRLSIPGYVLASAVAGAIAYQAICAYALYFGLAATDLKFATALFVLIVVAARRRVSDQPSEVAL